MQQVFGPHGQGAAIGRGQFADAAPGERLFFALFPPLATATALVALAQQLRQRHGLSGVVLPAEKLHVTLAFVGHFAPLPPDLLGAARAAGDRIAAAPFAIRFPQAGSFDGRGGRHPFVLRGGEHPALCALQAQLVAALKATRALAAEEPYVPHLTLLRDRKLVADEALGTPGWNVDSFALVRSGGEPSAYRVVQQWPLETRK